MGVREVYRHAYMDMVLFIAAFPEKLQKCMCPETLLMDRVRIFKLQELFGKMADISGW